MKKCLMFFLMLLLLITCGCSMTNKSEPKQISSNISQSDEVYYSISHGFTSEEREFIFDGEHPIAIPYFIKNGQLESEIGLCIYIDGIQQIYTLDVKSNTSLMHSFSFAPEEEKSFVIQFTPSIGQKGDVLSLNICTILNPDYMLSDTSYINFLPNHNLSSNTAVKIIMEESLAQATTDTLSFNKNYTMHQISSELKETFVRKDDNKKIERNLLDTITFYYIYQNSYDDGLLKIKNNKFIGYVDVLGKPGKYRISIYYNHTLVQDAFDGSPYLDIELEKDKVVTREVQFNVDTTQKLNHIYIIATPLPEKFSEYTQIEKTETILVEVQD